MDEYSKLLDRIARKINADELERMKFLCRKFIPYTAEITRMESILKEVFQFFCKLEAESRLGIDNLDGMKEMLTHLKKEDLASEVTAFQSERNQTTRSEQEENQEEEQRRRREPEVQEENQAALGNQRGRGSKQMDNPNKVALIVAPSYKGLPVNEQLPGTSYDVQVMRDVTRKLQFDDVKEVVGDNATKKKILQSLGDLSSTVKSGTIVLFYFSGHGYYLPSTKDEGLVPADATFEKLESNEKDTCITGGDLLPFLEQLAEKHVRLTVIFDCCYSGQLYRIAKFKNSGGMNIIPRQVIIEKSSYTKSPSCTRSEGPGNKLFRGGWTPREKDTFCCIAACNSVQLAFEDRERGGRLTMAIEYVVKSIPCFKGVSIWAFFRLIEREFKKNGWHELQTPQLEGASLDTELFGVKKVSSRKSAITVKEVIGNKVILEAGCIQNLEPGVYDVFEPTVNEPGVGLGEKSPDWLGSINVSEGGIGQLETSSLIEERNPDKDKKISPGCVAHLKIPCNIKTNAWVKIPQDSVPQENIKDLLDHIKNTKILNAFTQRLEDEDLITIEFESLLPSQKPSKFWVARRRGHIIVPPLGLGLEATMAGNLIRYLRYQFALASAQSPKSPDERLKGVSVKVVKIEKVKPFSAASKGRIIQEGLKSGKDLYEDAFQYPELLSHSLIDPKSNKLKDETGDAFVYQVTNDNKEDVNICVLFYQFDGAIKAIYPPKKGQTAVLRGGNTIEDIFRVFIPYNSLRKMAQPDPTKSEPDRGVDTIVVYAFSKPATLETLLQTPIHLSLIPRGNEKAEALSDLSAFSVPLRKRCLEDHDNEDFKWVVEKREFAVVKNTSA